MGFFPIQGICIIMAAEANRQHVEEMQRRARGPSEPELKDAEVLDVRDGEIAARLPPPEEIPCVK